MDHPDVLFVVLDSARRDRISAYGHERNTTPRFDRLAESSTLFENAYVPAPWTLPSHCSMFTGLFPSEHGVTNGFTDTSLELPSEIPTITEQLSDAGYRTAGFSNNPWVGSLSGLDRGFDEYVEWDLEIGTDGNTGITTTRDRLYSKGHSLLAQAARQPVFLLKRRFFTSNLVERANRWLESTVPDDRPSFTFLNLMEAHSPYFPPKSAFEELGLSPPGSIEPRVLNTKLLGHLLGKVEMTPEFQTRLLEFYDASLRYQDRKLAELLSTLERIDSFDDTLVIVCSDHGKTLGEYDRDGVPPHYTRPINTEVPLLVKRPGQREGKRVSAPAELAGIHDLVIDGGDHPEHSLGRDGCALVEDFVPHTGETSVPVTRWRLVSDGQVRYLRSEDDDEYIVSASDTIEDVEDHDQRTWLRDAMDRRVDGLRPAADRSDDADASTLDKGVKSQLGDLGYL